MVLFKSQKSFKCCLIWPHATFFTTDFSLPKKDPDYRLTKLLCLFKFGVLKVFWTISIEPLFSCQQAHTQISICCSLSKADLLWAKRQAGGSELLARSDKYVAATAQCTRYKIFFKKNILHFLTENIFIFIFYEFSEKLSVFIQLKQKQICNFFFLKQFVSASSSIKNVSFIPSFL